MKSSKSQAPSTRETSNTKLQGVNYEVRSLAWWEDGLADDQFVLKDEPVPDSNVRHPFDLEERTARFGEAILRFSKKIPRDPANDRLIAQLVGYGTSVGANYCEANEGVSKKDFRNTIGRCEWP